MLLDVYGYYLPKEMRGYSDSLAPTDRTKATKVPGTSEQTLRRRPNYPRDLVNRWLLGWTRTYDLVVNSSIRGSSTGVHGRPRVLILEGLPRGADSTGVHG